MGILENTQMQKNRFPVRYEYSKFVERYQILLKNNVLNDKKKINFMTKTQYICSTILSNKYNDYKFGITKVFLKTEHETFLQQVNEKN